MCIQGVPVSASIRVEAEVLPEEEEAVTADTGTHAAQASQQSGGRRIGHPYSAPTLAHNISGFPHGQGKCYSKIIYYNEHLNVLMLRNSTDIAVNFVCIFWQY